MKNKCDFTFRHYENILKSAKRRGFKFAFFTERNPSQKVIYLRHDIDVSFKKALKIAEIEKRNKVHSTFFIRIHSIFYNTFSLNSIEMIRKISELGHAIGLHYDGEINRGKINDLVSREYYFLKNFIPQITMVVSFHHSPLKVRDLELNKFINTYNNYFFKECQYISDSNRKLKEEPIKIIEDMSFKKIQILTHPIWWNKKTLSPKQNMKQIHYDLLKYRKEELEKGLKINIKCFKKFFGKR